MMDFGAVLEFMKKHPFEKVYWRYAEIPSYYKFRRKDWRNGYIFLSKGTKVPIDKWQGDIPIINDGVSITICSRIDMIDEEGKLIVGWIPTVEDMLAEDWELVENKTVRKQDGIKI